LDYLELTDSIAAPSAVPGRAFLYLDVADGSFKIKFGDGTVAVLAVNTGSDTVRTVPTGSVSLVGTIPVLSIGGSSTVAVPAGALSLTGQIPTRTVRGSEFFVYKSSDTSRSSTTVLAADPHLVIPVLANDEMFVTIRLLIQGLSTTGDFKFGWNVPSGTTMVFDRYQQSTLRDGFIGPSTGISPTGLSTETDVTALGGANAIYGFEIRGWIFAGATSGNVEFTWAQNVSNVNAMTVMAGSVAHVQILIP
jgi:hypothetical protein